MKKFLSFFAGALLLTACSNDDFAPTNEGQEQEVILSIELPQLSAESRAMAGSNSALGGLTNVNEDLTINVALYYGDNTEPAWTGCKAGKQSVTFNPTLVMGKNYKLVAYASYDNTINWQDAEPNSNTTLAANWAINDETKDAYSCVTTIKAETHMQATLTRPYGKLRIVTDDYQTAIEKNFKSEIKTISIAYKADREATYQTWTTGFADAKACELTADFASNYSNESGETKTLLIDYIPAPVDGTAKYVSFTVNVVFENNDTYTREFTMDIPVKRNYLTTLKGSFFTADATLEIFVDDAFAGEENIDMWDGNSVEEVAPNAEGVYEIANGAQLAWLAQQVNSKVTFKNEKVVLVADIDLGSNAWTPIGATGDVNGFQGTFDGQGHTIANLYIDQTDPQAYQSAGLFGCIAYATVTNFTVDNAVVKNYTTGSATSCGTAVVVGSVNSGANQATISNVTVKNAEVSSNRYVGGILGYGAATISGCTVDGIELVATSDDADNDGLYDNGDKVGGILAYANGAVTLTDNSVSNFKATAYREVGGIAGCVLNSSSVVTGNKVNTGTIFIDQSIAYEEVKDALPGEIVGRQAADLDLTSNTASDVTISYAVTGTGLASALEAAADQESATITLVGEVTWETGAGHGTTPWVAEGAALKNLVVEGNGNATLVATGAGVGAIRAANGGTITFKNLKVVDNSVSYTENSWEFGYLEFAGALKFENCEFVNAIMACGQTANNTSKLNAEFVNCTFNSNKESEYDVWVSGDNASFTGCKFLGYRGLKMHEAYGSNIAQVIVDGNSFGPLSKKPGIAIGDVDASTVVTIVNNTFTDCQPGDQGNYMYESDTDVTTFQFTCENNKVVSSVNSSEDFAATIKAGVKDIQLGAGTFNLSDVSGWSGDITITGSSKETSALTMSAAVYPAGVNLTLKNLTLDIPEMAFGAEQTYTALYRTSSLNIDNCNIKGCLTLCGYGETNITNCTFTNTVKSGFNGYGIFYYGYDGSVVNVKECTFDMVSKAIVIYNHSTAANSINYTLNVDGCTFKASTTDDKAAVQMHTEQGSIYGTVKINNSSATGFLDVNNGLWNEVNNNTQATTDYFDIWVDGVQVH